MKAIACEMCGSNDVVKQEGLYVCQHCGTKYTLEEARKLMIEGTVDVTGSTVKIDTADELENLYELARRSKGDNNTENAAKYYDMILLKDPYSWEATFYQVYYNSMNCRMCDIPTAAGNIKNSLVTVFDLIKETIQDEEVKMVAVSEVVERCVYISNLLFKVAKNNYDEIDSDIRDNFTQDMINRCYSGAELLYLLGDIISVMFAESKEIRALAIIGWKDAIVMHNELLRYFANKKANQDIMDSYEKKIREFDSSYKKPEFKTGGCYIATCVYGSYDCPEVWVLRRFRDDVLAENFIGRSFIKVYYALSPKIIKIFGRYSIVKSIWKYPLDLLISKLLKAGFDDTPYRDRC